MLPHTCAFVVNRVQLIHHMLPQKVDANIKKAATQDKRVPHVTSNGEMYCYRLLGQEFTNA